MRKLAWLLLFLSSVAFMSCDNNPPPTLPPATPGGGFIIQSLKSENGAPPVIVPGVTISVAWQSDLAGAAGDPSSFTVVTNSLGLAPAVGKRAPAKWTFTWVSAPDDSEICAGQSQTFTVPLNETIDVGCAIFTTSSFAEFSNFSLSPNPVYISAPPSTGTVTGNGLSSTYGMPLVQYYKLDGTFVAQENAASVASGGTSMQIPGFNIAQLPVGTFAAFVNNAVSGGSYKYLGTGAVQVANGGVWIDGSEQSTEVCHRWLAGGDCVNWVTVYDSGTVSITVNGVTSSVSYGSNSTPLTIAIGLANAINSNTSVNSLVQALDAGTIVMLNSKNGAQYSLSATATTSNNRLFPGGSFSATASGSTF